MTKKEILERIDNKRFEEIVSLGSDYAKTFSVDQNDTQDYLRVGFHVLGIPMYDLPSPLKGKRRGCNTFERTSALWDGEVILWSGGNYYLSVFEKNLDKE